jgi:hypothetical protein
MGDASILRWGTGILTLGRSPGIQSDAIRARHLHFASAARKAGRQHHEQDRGETPIVDRKDVVVVFKHGSP